ncbi:MAG: hypothetical protein STSR0007_14830 [Thermovirga sp.]
MNDTSIRRDLHEEEFCFLHVVSSSPEETRSLGEKISRFVLPGSFFLLYGDLGSGKTEFVRGFARGVGWIDVRSPSFTIVNEYPAVPPIVHADLYRINEGYSSSEFALEEYLRDGCVVLVEWAEHLDIYPILDAWEARFYYPEKFSDETTRDEDIRVIDITCCGERSCGSMKRFMTESKFIRPKQGK